MIFFVMHIHNGAMEMSNFTIVAALLLTSTVALAAEQPHRFYVAPNAGLSSFDISKGDLDEVAIGAFEDQGFTIIQADSSLDDEGTPWSIVAGWRFNQYIAAEVGYVNLG